MSQTREVPPPTLESRDQPRGPLSSSFFVASGPSSLFKPRLFALIVTSSPALSLLTVPTNTTGELDLAAFNRKSEEAVTLSKDSPPRGPPPAGQAASVILSGSSGKAPALRPVPCAESARCPTRQRAISLRRAARSPRNVGAKT